MRAGGGSSRRPLAYKTEEAPEKLISRTNPERKEINSEIQKKKTELAVLQKELAIRMKSAENKDKVTIAEFEKSQGETHFKMNNIELDISLLEYKRNETPSKIKANLADENVINKPERRMLVNLVKAFNYNCEKWLQNLFCEVHVKKDETLSLIRRVITQPGRIRQTSAGIEVELNRLDNATHAQSLDYVINKLNNSNSLRYIGGQKLTIRQAQKVAF